MTIFKLAIAGAALWPVLFLLASQRDPPTPPPILTAVAERWPDEPAIAPKADRLPLAAPAEVIIPAAVEAPIVVAAARTDVHQTVGATVSVRRHTDICTRHGMHRIETHGGRSWRCRR